MPDFLATGAAWLAGVFDAHVSQPVTYSRGPLSVSLVASVGKSEVEAIDEQGLTTVVRSVDFLFHTADLILGGKVITPQSNDTVVWAGRTYRVLKIPGEPESRPSDVYENRTRVHTKRVA